MHDVQNEYDSRGIEIDEVGIAGLRFPVAFDDGVTKQSGIADAAVFQHWRDGQCLENFEPDLEQPPSEHPGPWWDRVQEALAEGEGFGMAPVVALVLDHLGLALDDATLAAPWPTLTVAEDDAPSAPRGDSYAGEGPVPPGAIEIL
ncbi:hypothetical protein SGRIM128S_05326 [Streptomyces griseomycini]